MDNIHATHLNAFKYQPSEDESVSETSNMSGTFNKLNNSLKINQRKEKRIKSDLQSQIAVSESERSLRTDRQHDSQKYTQKS